MAININYISPEYGIALNKEEMEYFFMNVKYSKDLFPYVNNQDFEEMKKRLLDEKDRYNINDFLSNGISDSLFNSNAVYHEKEFSLYGNRDEVIFEAMDGNEDSSHYYFSLLLPCENKINYSHLSLGYTNQSDMIDELKNKYEHALPKDFNWESHLGFIYGVFDS